MRDRVFGIETEYALIYHPARYDRERPTNLQLYRRFEDALRRRTRTLPYSFSPLRSKVGRFLENGCTLHYEATVEDFEHGLIEMASPECRDPLTLIRYERAKDQLMEELADEVNRELEIAGWRGRVRIGKNNVDSAGHTFGSHENYWVEDRLPPWRRALFVPVWLALWAISLPVLAFVIAVQLGLLLGLIVAGLGVLLSSLALVVVRPATGRRLNAWMQRTASWFDQNPGELPRRIQRLVAPIYPLISLHSAVYNRFHFLGLRRGLTAFLVTRTIYSGSGLVRIDGGPLFRIAQRPEFLQAVSRIFPDGDRRPLYETRELFFRPWTALRSRRRLHLMIGDANLCEYAQLLRVGATALVLEAIESDVPIDWPVLADPLAALRRVGADDSLEEELELADGERVTALEIQRRCLREVRRALGATEPLPLWKARVLRDWGETLDLLERDREALADRIDWIAKRALLRRVVPDARDRAALIERGAEVMSEGGARTAADRQLRDLGFRLLREDLRYHEVGPRGGYRRLERRGQVRRLSSDEGVQTALQEPPADTRACARGAAIRSAHASALSGAAAWHRVRIGKFGWHFFSDPLDPEPSTRSQGRSRS